MPLRTESVNVDGLTWKRVSVEIGVESHLEDFKNHLLLHVRPEWKNRCLTSKVFDGGVNNALFAIYDEEKGLTGDTVLLRVNGSGTEKLICRIDEILSLLTLHKNCVSPPLYAQLGNGLCYGFVTGTPLSSTQLTEPGMIRKIARAMVKMHSLKMPASFRDREPQVWYKSEQWLELIPSHYNDPVKQRQFVEAVSGGIQELKKEMRELKLVLRNILSPVVFCHNDLTAGNLIYNRERDEIVLIDLEFAGPNYLAYEIANHFCEFAGVYEIDFNLYPSEEMQKIWIQTYLEESTGGAVSSVEVHQIYREVNKFTLSNHIFWTLWGLHQAEHSSIDFDYIGYAGIRYREYKKVKDKFLAL